MLQRAFDLFTAWAAGRSSKWPAARRRHLALHPSCEWCGHDVLADLDVHHVIPYGVDPMKELDPDNMMTACRAGERQCHFLQCHCSDWKSWNPNARADAAAWLRRVRTRPRLLTDGLAG